MNWIIRFYTLSLFLYPARFRARFAEEMVDVFHDGLTSAQRRGNRLGFVLREILRLPSSLVDVYLWSMQTGETRQPVLTGAGSGFNGAPRTEGWGSSMLAGLPHLLLGLVVIISILMEGIEGVDLSQVTNLIAIGFALLVLIGAAIGYFTGRRNWSASWVGYLTIVVLVLITGAFNALVEQITGNDNWLWAMQGLLVPLLFAYVLYKLAGYNRLHGLLAAMPLSAIIWLAFQEFVPGASRVLAWGWLAGVTFAATVLILRARKFSTAVWLALAVPALVGIPFAYLGVYQGGTLPFSEPGPSLAEMMRQYLPFLVMALAVILGPQLAVNLRGVGRSAELAWGKVFYRLALGGILLGLIFSMFIWIDINSNFTPVEYWMRKHQAAVLLSWLGLYMVGFAGLVWAGMKTSAFSGDERAALRMALLFVLLPGIPYILIVSINNFAKGFPSGGWLMTALELAWVMASAWLVSTWDESKNKG